MIGIPIALFLQNASEWFLHKHVLHGLGKKKGSFYSFHFFEHHRASRENGMVDANYTERSAVGWNPQGKEILCLAASTIPFLPLFPVAPFFVGTVVYSAINYYVKHRRAHLDPQWARENLPWHYDHHMGPDQDANWCVTRPWFDHIMGTRKPYAGTEREAQDLERKKQREATLKARAEADALKAQAAMPVAA